MSRMRQQETSPTQTSVRARSCMGLMVAGYIALAVMAGTPNSPLTTPLPAGAKPPGWAAFLATRVGLQHVGRPGLIITSLVVMAMVLAAFTLLLVEAWSGRVRLLGVLVASGAGLSVAVAAPLLLSRDVFSYAAYARIYALYHHNPYLSVPSVFPHDPFVAVTSAQWLHVHSLYGPNFTLIGAAIVRAWPASPSTVLFAFKVLAGAGIVAATICSVIAARAVRPERAALAAAIVGVNPVLVVHTVGGGHVDALIAAGLAGALALVVTGLRGNASQGLGAGTLPGNPSPRRSAAVTLLLTMTILIKVVVAPVLVLWLWWVVASVPPRQRARMAIVHLLLVAGLSSASLAPFLSGWHTLAPVATLGGAEGWASASHLLAHGAQALTRWLAGPGAGSAAGKLVVGSFLLFYAIQVWHFRPRKAPLDPSSGAAWDPTADGWGGSLLLLALAIPYLLPWYSAWFAPFLGLMDEALMWIGVAVTGLLALTLIPADPAHGISTWGVMLGVHYVVAPLMLGLFIAVVLVVRRRRAPARGLGV